MRHAALLGLLLLLPACGRGPTGPTPGPQPQTLTISLTDTVTGAALDTRVQTVPTLPASLSFVFPGYVTRQTTIRSTAQTVDLIPEAGFDLTFYRQFARGSLDGPVQPLRVLSQAPKFYLQTAGLSAANVAALEEAARAAVPALTGGRFTVSVFETGAEARTPQMGWIVVDVIDSPEPCGRSEIGTSAGHVWMNIAPRCAVSNFRVHPPSLAHEIGHALGFQHVSSLGSLMKSDGPYSVSEPSALERHHAAIAYRRQAGNRDVDSD